MAFNLIVRGDESDPVFDAGVGTYVNSQFPYDRMLEFTSSEARAKYEGDIPKLGSLPTLICAEGEDSAALFGKLSNVHFGDKVWGRTRVAVVKFTFQRLAGGFTFSDVVESDHISDLIHDWEFGRTHWAVKDGNLVEAVLETVSRISSKRLKEARPRHFRVEKWPLPVLRHIAVMMPFREDFDPVYNAIKSACDDQTMQAIRVDELKRSRIIVDDVYKTIIQSRLVICDFTGKNPNVAYEAGLAHALNREVIMIVQEAEDIGFDLRHRRYIRYSPTPRGLEELKSELSEYIRAARSSEPT